MILLTTGILSCILIVLMFNLFEASGDSKIVLSYQITSHDFPETRGGKASSFHVVSVSRQEKVLEVKAFWPCVEHMR